MVDKSPLMISVAGVRGIVGDSLTPEVALKWAAGFGTFCKSGSVVVGGDSRISKLMMREAIFAGLTGTGCKILDIGVVPTPTVALAVEHHRAAGGIAITASHNPAQWNALKFFNADGLFLDEQEGGTLRKHIESGSISYVQASQIGTLTRDDDAVRRHLEVALAIPFLDLKKIRARKFRVGLDCVNGAGGELLTLLLKELGCDVVGFYLEPTGLFPRNPEPLPGNLIEVSASMKAANIDIGFVVDPDADRLSVILENGDPAGEELTLVAAADLTLKYIKGPVVANCSTTCAIDDIAKKHGVVSARSKVGEAHVSRKMKELGAVIGGEGNGGVMLTSVHAARDTAVGIALILQAVLEHGRKASDYFHSLPQYTLVKHRKDFTNLDKLAQAIRYVESNSPFGEPDKLDGMKWTMGSSWVQIRASNTEPIVRVYAEAANKQAANNLAQQILNLLNVAK